MALVSEDEYSRVHSYLEFLLDPQLLDKHCGLLISQEVRFPSGGDLLRVFLKESAESPSKSFKHESLNKLAYQVVRQLRYSLEELETLVPVKHLKQLLQIIIDCSEPPARREWLNFHRLAIRLKLTYSWKITDKLDTFKPSDDHTSTAVTYLERWLADTGEQENAPRDLRLRVLHDLISYYYHIKSYNFALYYSKMAISWVKQHEKIQQEVSGLTLDIFGFEKALENIIKFQEAKSESNIQIIKRISDLVETKCLVMALELLLFLLSQNLDSSENITQLHDILLTILSLDNSEKQLDFITQRQNLVSLSQLSSISPQIHALNLVFRIFYPPDNSSQIEWIRGLGTDLDHIMEWFVPYLTTAISEYKNNHSETNEFIIGVLNRAAYVLTLLSAETNENLWSDWIGKHGLTVIKGLENLWGKEAAHEEEKDHPMNLTKTTGSQCLHQAEILDLYLSGNNSWFEEINTFLNEIPFEYQNSLSKIILFHKILQSRQRRSYYECQKLLTLYINRFHESEAETTIPSKLLWTDLLCKLNLDTQTMNSNIFEDKINPLLENKKLPDNDDILEISGILLDSKHYSVIKSLHSHLRNTVLQVHDSSHTSDFILALNLTLNLAEILEYMQPLSPLFETDPTSEKIDNQFDNFTIETMNNLSQRLDLLIKLEIDNQFFTKNGLVFIQNSKSLYILSTLLVLALEHLYKLTRMIKDIRVETLCQRFAEWNQMKENILLQSSKSISLSNEKTLLNMAELVVRRLVDIDPQVRPLLLLGDLHFQNSQYLSALGNYLSAGQIESNGWTNFTSTKYFISRLQHCTVCLIELKAYNHAIILSQYSVTVSNVRNVDYGTIFRVIEQHGTSFSIELAEFLFDINILEALIASMKYSGDLMRAQQLVAITNLPVNSTITHNSNAANVQLSREISKLNFLSQMYKIYSLDSAKSLI